MCTVRETSHFTSTPSVDGSGRWYVWDTYRPLPPRPVFVGTMEEAGRVADALDARRDHREPGEEP